MTSLWGWLATAVAIGGAIGWFALAIAHVRDAVRERDPDLLLGAFLATMVGLAACMLAAAAWDMLHT